MNSRRRRRALKKRSPILWLLLLMLLVGAAFAVLASLPIFQITRVEVVGTRLLASDEVARLADIPMGESIFLVSFDRARKKISRVPVVKQVIFSRVLPSTVLIRITERKEAVVCVMKDQSLILDDEGQVLNPQGVSVVGVELPDLSGLPVMNGQCISGEAGKEILKLLTNFKNFMMPQRLQVDVADTEDIKLLVDDILKVKIGNAQNLKRKMRNFEMIFSRIKDKRNEIDYIDVGLTEFPAVKFKH